MGPGLLIVRYVDFIFYIFPFSALYKMNKKKKTKTYKQQGLTDHLNMYNRDFSIHKMLSNV